MNTHAVCYTCDENIPVPPDDTCPACGGKVSDRHGKVWIVEWERREVVDE